MRWPASFLAALAATLLAGLVFALWPGLDPAAAALFHDGARFIGRNPVAETIRSGFFAAPYLCLAAAVAAWAAGRWRGGARRLPGRALVFLAATLALGPGLLVNVVLKEQSGRPRPAQTQDFGGAAEFRPYWRFDGACARNCSFVSGEVSSAAWTLAPALLTPPPVRAAAIAAAGLFTAATAALRMAAGGHFLSDVIFAALFTAMIVLAGARVFRLPVDAQRP
ncbi:MAG: phosphatase PAP2 family protein [Methylobacteriaceae bacterium]|nr:phosphatase PAP2 family protein [Methylobacteriaceae bacterium]